MLPDDFTVKNLNVSFNILIRLQPLTYKTSTFNICISFVLKSFAGPAIHCLQNQQRER